MFKLDAFTYTKKPWEGGFAREVINDLHLLFIIYHIDFILYIMLISFVYCE